MKIKIIFFLILSLLLGGIVSAQVRVRIFANQTPESAVFSVRAGEYKIRTYPGITSILKEGDPVLISKLNSTLVIKTSGYPAFICDSVLFSASDGEASFTLRINGQTPVRQIYSGDLQSLHDLGTLVFINTCDIESYISGVVRAEGGTGKHMEYFKTQAVIARTYMYKYFDKHLGDGFNLCDNTHCQAFNGITSDSIINRAAVLTRGQVILAPDSTLIISAFHSNCGGETAASEDVWLTGQSYLRKVTDPFCLTSRNTAWQQKISIDDWITCLRKNGFETNVSDNRNFNFSQPVRMVNYVAEAFLIPLKEIRSDLNLRSAFFSVVAVNDSVLLKGRGYGHGVGLCQEGAMVMASKGFDYEAIVKFYYTGVIISDIKNAVPVQKN
jgi:stage II sporulation protein D